jgi:hypothetical protein
MDVLSHFFNYVTFYVNILSCESNNSFIFEKLKFSHYEYNAHFIQPLCRMTIYYYSHGVYLKVYMIIKISKMLTISLVLTFYLSSKVKNVNC